MHRSRIDYRTLCNSINDMGEKALQEERERNRARETAESLLHKYADQIEFIQARVLRATSVDSGIRCALPIYEPIDRGIPCPAGPIPPVVVLAGDGSQINPDRHESIEFGLINAGLFRWLSDGHTTEEICYTTLLNSCDLILEDGSMVGDELFRTMRNVGERLAILDQSMREEQPVISLTDGPVELYRSPGSTAKSRELTNQYLDALRRLSRVGGVFAGYVDKPAANLVVRMLELTTLDDNQIRNARVIHPLRRLRDAQLYRFILIPGERSAIFTIESTSKDLFTGDLAVHFFYLNVANGKTGNRAWIARVEIPAWVANNKKLVEILHTTLIKQCELLGNLPYPYALNRAHEIAVVTRQEANAIRLMIEQEYRRRDVEIGKRSMKQELKDLLNGVE